MLPKLVTTLAIGATVFGVASASAAALDVNGGGTAQQTEFISATCDDDGITLTVETSRDTGLVLGVTLGNVSSDCLDADAVARFELGDGTFVSSSQSKVFGNRVFLSIPTNRQPTVFSVANTQVTIADQIRANL